MPTLLNITNRDARNCDSCIPFRIGHLTHPALKKDNCKRPLLFFLASSDNSTISPICSSDDLPRIYLAYYVILMIVLLASLLFMINQNLNYLGPLIHIFGYLHISYTPINLHGLFPGVLALVQLLFFGSIITRTLLPDRNEILKSKLLLKVSSFGFGIAGVGLIVTILADLHYLFFISLEYWVLAMITAILTFQALKSKDWKSYAGWIRSVGSLWLIDIKRTTLAEKVTLSVVGVVSAFVFYDSLFYPIVETDSIIYHASAAAIAFYNNGMPLIGGGGIGLGSSSNYPLLFSFTGAYFYILIGSVNDTFLKLIAPMMLLLAVLTTFVIGNKLGSYVSTRLGGSRSVGENVGSIAALLLITVPSFVQYGFQTTDETMLTFFISLGFMFLIMSLENPINRNYFVCAGIGFGAACLTSYQALYFIVPLILISAIKCVEFRNISRARPLVINLGWMILSLLLIGAAPYIRNAVIFRDPVYPFLSQIFHPRLFSQWLFNQTASSWISVAYSLVSPSDPTYSGFWSHLLTYQSFYPLNPILIVPAVILLPTLFLRHKFEIAAFLIIPSIFILFFLIPFVRYFWLVLPYAAIVVAAMISSSQRALDEWLAIRKASLKKLPQGINRFQHALSRFLSSLKLIVPIILALMLLFPTMVVFANNNYTFIPFESNYPPQQYFLYFDHPGIPASTVLSNDYGSDTGAWNWLSDHYTSGKIATFENRVYYLQFALKNPNIIYYLDAYYSVPLYTLGGDQATISQYLRSQNISYIFVESQDWRSALFQSLSFWTMLGSPYFPLLYSNGTSDIFGVGPGSTSNSVVSESNVYAYTYGLPNITSTNGKQATSVPVNNTTPRLFVETDNRLTLLNIVYLDKGHGALDLNIFDPVARTWVGCTSIQKTGSGMWKNASILVPTNFVNSYAEFGLYAEETNFVISAISANHVASAYRTSYSNLTSLSISNTTTPKSLMIYLPVLDPLDKVSIISQTNRFNVSLEIFKGYTPLNVTTNWWLQQENVARVPADTLTTRLQSPSLSWTPSAPGIYTLIIVNWDPLIKSNIDIAVSISITSSSAISQGMPFQ